VFLEYVQRPGVWMRPAECRSRKLFKRQDPTACQHALQRARRRIFGKSDVRGLDLFEKRSSIDGLGAGYSFDPGDRNFLVIGAPPYGTGDVEPDRQDVMESKGDASNTKNRIPAVAASVSPAISLRVRGATLLREDAIAVWLDIRNPLERLDTLDDLSLTIGRKRLSVRGVVPPDEGRWDNPDGARTIEVGARRAISTAVRFEVSPDQRFKAGTLVRLRCCTIDNLVLQSSTRLTVEDRSKPLRY
jgi:hypothetical protein